MKSTHSSLITRLRNTADHAAWAEFEARYRELLVRFCRRRGLQEADAEDVVQHVFAGLSRSMAGFAYDPSRGRFRDYLCRCVVHAISKWSGRRNGPATPLDTRIAESLATRDLDPVEAHAWEEEWVDHHYRTAMATVRKTFDPKSVEIFHRSVGGATVVDLAREFRMSAQAVHKVRQRIRNRMEELVGEQVREEDAVDEHARL